ncbi:hypothetical protein JG687_00000911 [Phytophthora cactorum]|uniref:Uncharacterized protein n=1 Tax=Phytophthora cactorum TaxID=29920 RepID=A0A329STF3_9STRA|nr:hypothetical protein Pcac1_g7717 [Phytophthora cactorum]KAG2842988.1 hypothetical protein PC112_g2820 [Phytophthora cactorum]KAG2843900.1 hypothetical protein PC111_g2197 [Phytophthora cactorum]KAG2866040.1 hypothetical protein PC113_g3195 [Phytophthora cactorum]KAG2928462.1 hypothetical protein PC114_g3137 [Phytophthora cactorum]
MALLARTFRTIVGLPWRSFELLDQTLRWSAVPEKVEDPTSEIWAEDLFTPCSTKCLLSTKYSYDDDTDSSGFEFNYESDICDEEDDEEWSCSESDEEVDGFSFRSDGDVDFWGDHWFWTTDYEDDDGSAELIALVDVEMSNYVVERLVDYVMPTMSFSAEATIDVWIEKYGSSALQHRFVTVVLSEPSTMDTSTFMIPSTSTGLFVAVL